MPNSLHPSREWVTEFCPQQLLIDNKWISVPGQPFLDVLDPSNEMAIASVPQATPVQVKNALQSLSAAQDSWANISAWKRSEYLRLIAAIMRRDVDSYAKAMTLEQGKPLTESAGEVVYGASFIEWYAEEAKRVWCTRVEVRETDSNMAGRQGRREDNEFQD